MSLDTSDTQPPLRRVAPVHRHARKMPPANSQSHPTRPWQGLAFCTERQGCALRAHLGSNAAATLARKFGGLYREDYFRRKLNGQIPFNLTEVMALVIEFGSALEPIVLSTSTLVPDLPLT